MQNPPTDDDALFLRDLVKAARQKPHHVAWVDRDGGERHTTLSDAEAKRLTALSQRQGVGMREVLRRAAHIPKVAEPRSDAKQPASHPSDAGAST